MEGMNGIVDFAMNGVAYSDVRSLNFFLHAIHPLHHC